MSDKIKPQHLSRKAILYVRQPSAYQVLATMQIRVYVTARTRMRACSLTRRRG